MSFSEGGNYSMQIVKYWSDGSSTFEKISVTTCWSLNGESSIRLTDLTLVMEKINT